MSHCRRVVTALVAGLLTAGGLTAASPASASVSNPGSFTGYGFDTCTAPSQAMMDVWRRASPYAAVGIYISGSSRACAQPNLTRGWVQRQSTGGWRLLPIHVGRQAPCYTGDKKKMSSNATTARTQGVAAAVSSARAATSLGIGKGYLNLDIEHYDISRTRCDKAVLAFIDGWTARLGRLGYRSSVYSSASAAIESLGRLRADAEAAQGYHFPGHLWIAWGNGRADTAAEPYLDDGLWRNHDRIHQYVLDRVSRHGGVSIHIDRNWLDVGSGSHAVGPSGQCGTPSMEKFRRTKPGMRRDRVRTIRCLLTSQGHHLSTKSTTFGDGLERHVRRFQRAHGVRANGVVNRRTWVALLSFGGRPVLKRGSYGQSVHRLQRSLAAALGTRLPMTGLYDQRTGSAVRTYRDRLKLPRWPTAEQTLWSALQRGRI